MNLTPSQVIVLATPVFLLAIALEWALGVRRGRNTYRLNDAINSMSLGMLSEATGVLLKLFKIGVYTALAGAIALWRNDAFWLSLPGWLLALLFYDFCYYWQHRCAHRVALLWATHVVHHQSQDYNLSTALRQPSTGSWFNWVFYVPMALAGVPPLVFGTVALIDLLYQFWVHTEQVGKLGWFDRWFCSPSNHRVHHAVNDAYLDRNYGGVLLVWDRLFGTWREEDERAVYGTRAPLASWDPLWSNLEVYWALGKDSWHARSWADKLRVWFKPPGWRPADVAQRFPRPPFDVAKVQRYHPPMEQRVAVFASVQFALVLAGVLVFLWFAGGLPLPHLAAWVVALGAALWAVGAVVQGRITPLQVVLVEVAALAAATAATGFTGWHQLFKPLAMVLAIACVLQRGLPARLQGLLVAALALSLAGDVFLMLEGFFIPGLASFLLAHLCYIVLFRQGVPWFGSGRALAATLALAAAMYAFLFPHLGPVLKVAVAAYSIVIALMAAQAIGRALSLRDGAAAAVAAGAMFFMLSDSMLAVNRFAQPLPMAQFAVLATYYVAQILIALNVGPADARVVAERREAASGSQLPAT